MNNIAGIPYIEVEFDRAGQGPDPSTVANSIQEETTDLFVISHGWNNDSAEARTLYTDLFTNLAAVASSALGRHKPAIVGIIWPSKRFDELVAVEPAASSGGGLAVGPSGSDPEAEKALREKIDVLKKFFNDAESKKALDAAKKLIPDLENKEAARDQFVTLIRGLVSRDAVDKEDASDIFFRSEPEEIMEQLRIAEEDVATEVISDGAAGVDLAAGGAQETGGAAGIGQFLSGFKTAAMNVLNYTSYYEMKERAGKVGKNGVAPLIDILGEKVQRIHLIGHSFGARVVAAAAANSAKVQISSMSLLQAAFSHNAFSKSMEGFFRSVVDRQRVRGPILITYTKNDKAVGVAYPIASRLAGQVASALGDANDKYGGLGRNGAQKMNAEETVAGPLLETGKSYSFVQGKFFNLEGGTFITGHGAVTGKEVAHAIAAASFPSS